MVGRVKNKREEILKSLHWDFPTGATDLAFDFYGGEEKQVWKVISYLRRLGWEIRTLHNGAGSGYLLSRAHFDLLQRAFRGNYFRGQKQVRLSPREINRWVIRRYT